jgi:transposase-like protein
LIVGVRGRRPVLTDTVIEKICEAYEIGASYRICAAYAGVSVASISNWLRQARELQERIENGERVKLTSYQKQLLKFLDKLTEAEANDAMNLLAVIDKAASQDPVWAEKRLLRRYPDMIIANRAETKISVDQPIIIEWRVYNEGRDAPSSSRASGDSEE